jgi:hypothetical protein
MSADMEVVFTPWPYDAVARGVALLDEKVPGWRTKIDLGELNVAGFYSCPLGQIGGDFEHGAILVGLQGRSRKYPEFGFYLEDDGGGTFEELNAAWREAIAGGGA